MIELKNCGQEAKISMENRFEILRSNKKEKQGICKCGFLHPLFTANLKLQNYS